MNKKRILKIILISFIGLIFVLSIAKFMIRNMEEKNVNKIGLVQITGPMYNSKKTVDLLRQYGKDDRIKAILIRLDTPGGGVAVAQEITREIQKIRNKGKYVASSMGSVAASGGYYVASASDIIFADAGTITGSIGVIINITNVEELLKKIGIKSEVIKSGVHKDVGSPTKKLTKEDEKLLQDIVNDIFQQFVDAIVDGRFDFVKARIAETRKVDEKSITREDVKNEIIKVADGRIFSGVKAKELGLIDEIGNFNDAVDFVAKQVGIAGEPVIVKEEKRFSLFEFIFGEDAESMFSEYLSNIPLKYQLDIGKFTSH